MAMTFLHPTPYILLDIIYIPDIRLNKPTMCYHTRIIYVCGHTGWGGEVLACPNQKSFNDGIQPEACDTMNAHPLHSLKVRTTCKECAKVIGKMSKAKFMAEEMRRIMAKIHKHGEQVKEEFGIEVSPLEEFVPPQKHGKQVKEEFVAPVNTAKEFSVATGLIEIPLYREMSSQTDVELPPVKVGKAEAKVSPYIIRLSKVPSRTASTLQAPASKASSRRSSIIPVSKIPASKPPASKVPASQIPGSKIPAAGSKAPSAKANTLPKPKPKPRLSIFPSIQEQPRGWTLTRA
jgi:hypothetical protein